MEHLAHPEHYAQAFAFIASCSAAFIAIRIYATDFASRVVSSFTAREHPVAWVREEIDGDDLDLIAEWDRRSVDL